MTELVATAATEDRLLGGRVVLRQPAVGYRAAIDPVLLAAAVPAPNGAGAHVLDAGCGVGAAALCLAVRRPDCRVVGVEIQPALAALARVNAQATGVADRVTIIAGDIASTPATLAAASFDHVMANPPFHEVGRHTPPPDAAKALANVERGTTLGDWIDGCHRLLRPTAWLTLIHRADRIDEICARLYSRFGAVEVVPLWPRQGRPARRVIVRARKGVRSPAAVSSGLVLHESDGRYTSEAEAILRDGAALAV